MDKIMFYILLGATVVRLILVAFGNQLEQWEQIVWLLSLVLILISNKKNYI